MSTKKKEITYEDYQKLSGTSFLNARQAIDVFEQMVWSESTFMTVFMNEINMLQIMLYDDRFVVEITNDSEDMVFHQKYATDEECRQLLMESIETDNIAFLDGFYAVPVHSKTLEDVVLGR